ncbi:MAG: hypothetical protein ACI4AH_05305 [Muribaculaceae bacterium]
MTRHLLFYVAVGICLGIICYLCIQRVQKTALRESSNVSNRRGSGAYTFPPDDNEH